MSGSRAVVAGLLLAVLAGCARQGATTRDEGVALCYRGSGLTPALGAAGSPATDSPTLVLDSIVERGGRRFHARVAAGERARGGYWQPGPRDTVGVVLQAVYPPVVYLLQHRGRQLVGTGRRAAQLPGFPVDTTPWSVNLVRTRCAPVLAQLRTTAGSGPAFPDSLRTELAAMDSADQAARAGLTAGSFMDTSMVRRLARGDSARTARLEAIVARWGWPAPSRAGETAASGAFLVLQHSPSTAFQRRLLPVLDTLAGVGEVSGQEVALLTDRLLKQEGRPQRYGSQFDVKHGTLVLYPIEDSAHVDERRAAMGLVPLAAYVEFVRKMYHAPAGH